MGKLLKFVIFLMQLINELDKVLCFIGIRLYPLTRSSILWGMYVFQLFAFTCIIDLTINKENENLSSDDDNSENLQHCPSMCTFL